MTSNRPDRSAWIVAGSYALAPILAAAGGLALAPLAALAGAFGARRFKLAATPALVLFALFIAWVALSAAWSASPQAPLAAGKLIGGVATGLLLVIAARARGLVRSAGLACACVLSLLLLVEALFAMPLSRLADPDEIDWVLARNPGRGASFLLLILGAAVYAAHRLGRRWLALTLMIAAGFLAFQFGARSNVLALIAGALAATAAMAAPRLALGVLGGGIGAAILVAPFLAALVPAAGDARLPSSWGERLAIWRSCAARITEAPWFGHGLDSARTMSAPFEADGVAYARIPLHPHNAAMHIWLETGALGALLAAAAALLLGRALAHATPRRGEAAVAAWTMSTFAALSFVSFGLWQEWWVAAAFLTAALAAAARTPRSSAD